jgi:hypothetical protein
VKGASEKELDSIRDKHDNYNESIEEARDGDTNFGSTVTRGSWVVYDGSKVKRFKSRDGAKAYAEKNGGKVASSEYYADKIQGKQDVSEGLDQEFNMQLAKILKQRGYKGPVKLEQLGMKWVEAIGDIVDIDDYTMVQGNDPEYDGWVSYVYGLGKYAYGAEQGYTTGTAKRVEIDTKDEQGVAEGETWSKHNNPRAGGMSKKSVSSYRRSHPGSKIQTAVTTKPSKLKKGSKAAKRRKSFCARMKGMKKSRTSAKTARDPNSNINKSLRRWNCESVEQMRELVMLAEQFIAKHKK